MKITIEQERPRFLNSMNHLTIKKESDLIRFFLILLLSACCSCSGGGGGSSGGSGGQSSVSGWPGGDYQYLNQHNARFNNGIIIRWQTPVLVNTNGIPGAEDSFRQWGLPLTFVDYTPAEGITVNMGDPGTGACGVTLFQWFSSNGRIISARITIRPGGCLNNLVLTHEAAHALGFADHTSDGGLMDPNGGNGQITAPVRNMMNLLYSLPIGTNISSMLSPKLRSPLTRLEYKHIPDGGGMVTHRIE